ncbi:SHOCT domain-containing protein [Salinisphaera sp. Q1T1-3]|uniref:SHOCT domain-containing protein n=1 Tax=Salinisphaera sp. Q1T1-3 TaxID=2321229 RepID=UPI000E718C72|nr:SHOCT domain-containing protein [Salinisphaera sp. Q1T1-3]RJS93740.1 SHOCT domain-containing protein [Salinisphaera sp. Q1T1-3]
MAATMPSRRTLADLSARFDFSEAAVAHLARAVEAGGGDMAMFDHPEFCGPGQWMRGGLILITDPSDTGRKHRIDALCNALSALRSGDDEPIRTSRVAEPRGVDVSATRPAVWWPAALGQPSAMGEQDDLCYAYFDRQRRLVVQRAGAITVYDTGDHRITGISQSQQGRHQSVIFTSQYGEVPLGTLPRAPVATEADDDLPPEPAARTTTTEADRPALPGTDIFDAIERLGALRDRGLLTEAEFAAKKQALLSRL